MTTFLRLLSDKDKGGSLRAACALLRAGETDPRLFEVAPQSFRAVPGAPFSYWVSDAVRLLFKASPPFESKERTVRQGVATADDFRFARCWWEVNPDPSSWPIFSKGGNFCRFYDSLPLVCNWRDDGAELRTFTGSAVRNPGFYFKPGLTWPLRSHTFCPQILPSGTIFSTRGSLIYSPDPLMFLGLFSSGVVDLMLRLLSGREGHPQYDMGDISLLPIPVVPEAIAKTLSHLSRCGWSIQRSLRAVEETSHAFSLPRALRLHVGDFDPPATNAELARIQAEIDDIAFDLYGFSESDRAAAVALPSGESTDSSEGGTDDEDDEAEAEAPAPSADTLLSWAVGVAFARFDLRLATGEREAPLEPEPFDPLPTKSPGMLPDGATPFHVHSGILVDDPGHRHDLVHLVEDVLARVEMPVPGDLRRWLQKDFFAFHLPRYSKSRRKAPIYWPLATASGSYTLWLYYPSWDHQTLYTAINDFIEGPSGKLAQVSGDLASLRSKGATRSRDEEKRFEAVEALELELIELRDQLLKIAPGWHPNHDDGVQISAAPLWPLFRHKPWQKILKETWAKLEKGDYDWAHLAMSYWPDRVREKCKTDKSLAIAHGLEALYIEPPPKAAAKRGRKAKEA